MEIVLALMTVALVWAGFEADDDDRRTRKRREMDAVFWNRRFMWRQEMRGELK